MGISLHDQRLDKGKWYKWQDMLAKVAHFTIVNATIENFAPPDKEPDYKPTLWLRNAAGVDEEKGFGMNVGIRTIMEEEMGDNSDQWIGRTIELRVEKTPYEGKIVNCLRLYVPELVAPPAPAAPPAIDVTQQYPDAPADPLGESPPLPVDDVPFD
jgi:hypothetical protein